MKRRLFSLLLCLCMALTLLPAPAEAASAPVTDAAGLKAAIEAGGTVTLGGDFTVSERLTVNKSVTLDLNGHTVTAAQNLFALFQVEAGASFILQDSGTGGTLQATEPTNGPNPELVYMKGGEFWLQGGTLDAGARGYAVDIANSATGASFLMTGGALKGKTALYLQGGGSLAVVTGGSLRGSNNALYVDGASYVYLGGDVTTDGSLHNPKGALTVTGGTHSGALYTGSAYNSVDVTTAMICGGDFHGVWQDDYGTLALYGGSFGLASGGTYSFKTDQTDQTTQVSKTLTDYVGAGAALDPNDANGTAAFSVTKPANCAPQLVGVFGGGHGTVKAGGTTLGNATRLITNGAKVAATADEGYVSHVDTSKDGVVLVTFAPEAPVATLSWTESGESQSAQLTEREVRYGRTNDYLRDADQAAGASMTFLADTAALLSFEGVSPVTLTGDENGPYTLSRDMADGGHSKTGKILSIGYDTSVTVTKLTLDGSVPPEPPYSTDSPEFITVNGSLTLGDGATVQNCQPSNNSDSPALPPAAVDVRGGDLTLASGSKVVNNQSRNGGVVKNYSGTVSLSGNVTVKGNEAVDLSDVYSFDPDELAAAPRIPANLVMYKTQRKAAGAPIQVTGPLTGGEGSIGLTLLYTEADPEPTTGKIVAGTERYTLQDSDLAAFFSDLPGYFLALNTGENAIYLDAYAITTQPTAEVPTVAVNQTKDAAYQWYPTTVVTEPVTEQNVIQTSPKGTYLDSKWTAVNDSDSPVYFTLALKKGDSLAVTLPTAEKPERGQLGLYDKEHYEQLWYYFKDFDPDEGVTAAEDGDNTVITYTVPADGPYTLMLDGLSADAPAVSATVKGVHLGEAVSGQTTDTLTADEGGTYLCRVTWPDGTVLDSDVVAYTPPVIHIHAVSVGCENDSGDQVTFQPLPDLSAVSLNGHTLTEGSYYLTADAAVGGHLTISGDVKLCLNGHTLSLSVGKGIGSTNISAAISVPQGCSLTVCDCTQTKGKIAYTTNGWKAHAAIGGAGDVTLYGCAVETSKTSDFAAYGLCNTGGTFTLYDSHISATHATSGADQTPHADAVEGMAGTTVIHGGSLSATVTNSTTYTDGNSSARGLYVSPDSTAYLLGNPTITTSNTTNAENQADVYVSSPEARFWLSKDSESYGGSALTVWVSRYGYRDGGTVIRGMGENGPTVTIKNAPNGLVKTVIETEGRKDLVLTGPYTVKFDANGGEGTMADLAFTGWTDSKALTANGFTGADGAPFQGWNTKADGSGTSYTDGATVSGLAYGGRVTLYAQWGAATHVHDWATAWSKNDTHHWHACTAEGCDITDYSTCSEAGAAYAAHVYDNDADATCNTCGYERSVTPSDPGESKGEVEVKGDTPPVTVDKDALKDLAGEVPDGDTVTVKLTVEKQDSPADKDDIQAVVTGKKDDVLYLDLSLLKQVNNEEPEPITDTEDKVLEIKVPYGFTGKKDVTVYRKHGNDPAAALDKLTEKPTEAFTDGSFFADSRGGAVYIYASKFSTYAIGYTAETAPVIPSGGSTGGGYVGPITVYSPKDGQPLPFTDVKSADPCYESVKYVYEKGWMQGTSDTAFEPQGQLSRAMLATVLYRAAGSPKVEGAPAFEDALADAWYSDAVLWASQTHVLRGYGNGKFGPEDPVSREMMNMVTARQRGEDPAWTGDAALAIPATRAEAAALLMELHESGK